MKGCVLRVILAGRRLSLKCHAAGSVADTSVPSDSRNRENSIFGEFFLVFNGFQTGSRQGDGGGGALAAVRAWRQTKIRQK